MDYVIRVVAILVILAIGYTVLKKIDPLGGKDYSGVPTKAKIKITVVVLIIFALLLFIKSITG
jgi:hypothetical protein